MTLPVECQVQLAAVIRTATCIASLFIPKHESDILRLHMAPTSTPLACVVFPGRQHRLSVRPREAASRRILQTASPLLLPPSTPHPPMSPPLSRPCIRILSLPRLEPASILNQFHINLSRQTVPRSQTIPPWTCIPNNHRRLQRMMTRMSCHHSKLSHIGPPLFIRSPPSPIRAKGNPLLRPRLV